jgi:hypothetical protein
LTVLSDGWWGLRAVRGGNIDQCGVPEPDWANLPDDGLDILPFESGG